MNRVVKNFLAPTICGTGIAMIFFLSNLNLGDMNSFARFGLDMMSLTIGVIVGLAFYEVARPKASEVVINRSAQQDTEDDSTN